MKSTLFRFGMYWRLVYGMLRALLGLTLLGLVNVPLTELLHTLMSHELIEDPTDIIYTTLNTFLQFHPLSITYFLSIYLIFWGVADIVLSDFLSFTSSFAFHILTHSYFSALSALMSSCFGSYAENIRVGPTHRCDAAQQPIPCVV